MSEFNLKPLMEGLFGKQRESLYERPDFGKRKLSEMLFELNKIPVLDWYVYAFSSEPLRGRVSKESQKRYMEESWKCGKEQAIKTKLKYQDISPKALASKMNLNVEYPDMPEKTDRVLFAEFREPNNIRIYLDAIKRVENYIKVDEIKDIIGNLDISDVLLLHEIFHSIEEKNKQEIYTKTEKIKLWSIGSFHYTSCLVALSEIAAMSFAYHYLELEYSPYLLDVLLVYGYSKEEANGLYEEMIEYANTVKGDSCEDTI